MNNFLDDITRLWWIEVGTELNNPTSEASIKGLKKVLREDLELDNDVITYIVESIANRPSNFSLKVGKSSGIDVGKNQTAVSAQLHPNWEEEEGDIYQTVDLAEEEDDEDTKKDGERPDSGDDKEDAEKDIQKQSLTALEKDKLKKEAIDDKLLKTKLKNPTTGNMNQVNTLLGKKKSDPSAYKVGKDFLGSKGVSDDEIESAADSNKDDTPTNFSSEDNRKSLDDFVEKGFANSEGAPGSAGSMLNEIFSSTGATDVINSGKEFDYDSTLDATCNQLKGSGLGKDNKSNNLPTGVKKSEAQPIAEKYGISLGEAGKAIIATRAAQSKNEHVTSNILKKNNIKNAKAEPFFGDKKGMKAQEDMVAGVSGTVLLGNTEVTKEEAIEIIRSGGGGANPSDTAIFVTNEDTGDLHMTFYSDKDNVSALVAQSSLKAEFNLKKKEVDKLVEKGTLNKEQAEAAKRVMDESEAKHREIESKLDSVTAGPGKHLDTIETGKLVELSKTLSKGANPSKYWDNNIKKKMLKSSSSEYLPDGSDNPPTDEQIMKGFVNYANANPTDLTKDEQRIIADLSNSTDGPRLGAEIGKIRKATISTDLDTIKKLNETKVMIDGKEVGMGNVLEAESVAEKLHLGMMFGGEGVFKDSDAFYQESGGVKVDRDSLAKCLPFDNKNEMIKNFKVGEENEQIKKGGTAITGGSKIIYAVTQDGKEYPIGEKKQRSKTGILGKLATVYNYHPSLQKCLKKQ
jgi:hypothetical protein